MYVLSLSDLEKRKMPTTATTHLRLFCWVVFPIFMSSNSIVVFDLKDFFIIPLYLQLGIQMIEAYKGNETPKLN